jgi:molybdate transport system substrate-binding protein
MLRRRPRALALAVILFLTAPSVAHAEALTLSVAVSMKEAIEEIGRLFTKAHPAVALRYNLGASGELQKQIEAGAPVDVFISAAQRQMDDLERRGLIVAGSRRVFARNVLVAVVPAGSRDDLARPAVLADPKVTRIAVGNPKTVPAGQYTKESLRALGLWDRLQSKLVLAENVRQVLDYVSRGEVDVGFVYATDVATRAGRVKEAFRPAEETYPPIVYPAAVTTDSRSPIVARAFVDLLVSAEGQAILRRLGFQPAR